MDTALIVFLINTIGWYSGSHTGEDLTMNWVLELTLSIVGRKPHSTRLTYPLTKKKRGIEVLNHTL